MDNWIQIAEHYATLTVKLTAIEESFNKLNGVVSNQEQALSSLVDLVDKISTTDDTTEKNATQIRTHLLDELLKANEHKDRIHNTYDTLRTDIHTLHQSVENYNRAVSIEISDRLEVISKNLDDFMTQTNPNNLTQLRSFLAGVAKQIKMLHDTLDSFTTTYDERTPKFFQDHYDMRAALAEVQTIVRASSFRDPHTGEKIGFFSKTALIWFWDQGRRSVATNFVALTIIAFLIYGLPWIGRGITWVQQHAK